jgi:inhibitor of cysteine peptidase
VLPPRGRCKPGASGELSPGERAFLNRLVLAALVCLAPVLAACAGDAPQPVPPTPASASPSANASAASSAGAGAHTVKIGDADAGKTVAAKVGDTVELTLEANPSTGYDWQVDKVDKTLGQPKLSRPQGPAPEGRTGAPSTVTFSWTLAGPLDVAGDHAVELAYRRPWEKDEPPERTFKFTLHVAR